jgi:hypothetical protein
MPGILVDQCAQRRTVPLSSTERSADSASDFAARDRCQASVTQPLAAPEQLVGIRGNEGFLDHTAEQVVNEQDNRMAGGTCVVEDAHDGYAP